MKIYSTVNTQIILPPYFKDLTDKEGFSFNMKANEPFEIPDKIAEYYLNNRPQQFKKADGLTRLPKNVKTPENKEEVTESGFNAKQFVKDNLNNIDEAIIPLNEEETTKVAEVLMLKIKDDDTIETIKAKIIRDIKSRLVKVSK